MSIPARAGSTPQFITFAPQANKTFGVSPFQVVASSKSQDWRSLIANGLRVQNQRKHHQRRGSWNLHTSASTWDIDDASRGDRPQLCDHQIAADNHVHTTGVSHIPDRPYFRCRHIHFRPL